MKRLLAAVVVTSMLFIAVAVSAMPPGPEPAQQYPVMEGIAKKVIQKYQASSCQQLWAEKGQVADRGAAPETGKGDPDAATGSSDA